MKNEISKHLGGCLLAIIASPVAFLSWIYFNFKTYSWYKPHTGEFAEMLPDLTYWNMFAISTVLTALFSSSAYRINVNRTLNLIQKEHLDKQDIEKVYTKLGQSLLYPWIGLLVSWLLYVIIF